MVARRCHLCEACAASPGGVHRIVTWARLGASEARGCDDGGVALYRDEGVVLRVQKLGEADRIVTVLTRRSGRIRAVGKGVRRTRSKFGSRLEPFSHVALQLAEGRSLDVVTEAVALDAFGAQLSVDYARYTTGTAMLEAAERLTAEEREPALRLYLMLVSALRALGEGQRPPTLLLDAFLLRALGQAGYGIALAECARCGEPGPHRAFSVPAGGSVCPACRPSGAASPPPAVLALRGDLLEGDWDAALVSVEGDRRAASGLVAASLQWHLERGLRSLPLVERR
jgi:DNA repair protein RecO (recombination protein O)